MRTKSRQPVGWKRNLSFPIRLRDGHTIETMEQAAGIMTLRHSKQRQLKPVWQKTAGMFMRAHETGEADDLAHATLQLQRALNWEGWAD
jgi:hypothetical protein